jgi:hypothetical protein
MSQASRSCAIALCCRLKVSGDARSHVQDDVLNMGPTELRILLAMARCA